MKYLLKTKGTSKIPDYLQIRDEHFQLIAHCTVKKSIEMLKEQQIDMPDEDIVKFVDEMPFGKLTEILNK